MRQRSSGSLIETKTNEKKRWECETFFSLGSFERQTSFRKIIQCYLTFSWIVCDVESSVEYWKLESLFIFLELTMCHFIWNLQVDIDELTEIADDFDVSSVPVLVVIRDGKVEKRMVGLQDTDKIRSWVQSAVKWSPHSSSSYIHSLLNI